MTVEATIQAILGAGTFTQRIQQIRLVPQRHGTEDHGTIYAAVARELSRTVSDPTTTDEHEPTLQVGPSTAGVVTCAAPPLTFDGGPATYPALATAWGGDEPRWPDRALATTNGESR